MLIMNFLMSNISALELELEKKQNEIKPVFQKLRELRLLKHEHKIVFDKYDKLARKLTNEIEELTDRIKNMKRLRS